VEEETFSLQGFRATRNDPNNSSEERDETLVGKYCSLHHE
jgi:hypothetical protein